jgi:hypothetical protein
VVAHPDRYAEADALVAKVTDWLDKGVEPRAIGVSWSAGDKKRVVPVASVVLESYVVVGLCSFVAYLFERGGVGREIGVVDLAVEIDDEFEFPDRLVQVAVRSVNHRDVIASDGFAGAVADLPLDVQGLGVVGQRLLPVAQPVLPRRRWSTSHRSIEPLQAMRAQIARDLNEMRVPRPSRVDVPVLTVLGGCLRLVRGVGGVQLQLRGVDLRQVRAAGGGTCPSFGGRAPAPVLLRQAS